MHRDLRATQQHQGVYVPPERYSSMVGQLEQQQRDITQKVDHIKTLEQEMQKKEVRQWAEAESDATWWVPCHSCACQWRQSGVSYIDIDRQP